MAKKYTLTYFKIVYLAEPVRYLLNYGKLNYEDKFVEFSEWPETKKKVPYGRMPVLEFDDVKVNQSIAICRYLAKIVGLDGKDDVENLKMDCIVHNIDDVRQYYGIWFGEKDEQQQDKLKKKVVEEIHPFMFSALDKTVEENKGYFVNGKLSWVDLNFAAFAIAADHFEAGVFDKYPNLKNLWKKVEEIPQIKEYIARRPE